MKFLFSAIFAALVAAVVAIPCRGDDTTLVPNGHGGYNVAQGQAKRHSFGLFGPNSFATHQAKYAKEHPESVHPFIVVQVLVDDGHGNKHFVQKKVYYRTQEEADAAQAAGVH